jgi:hypothetical protein
MVIWASVDPSKALGSTWMIARLSGKLQTPWVMKQWMALDIVFEESYTLRLGAR